MTRRELAVCIYNQIKENMLGHDNKLPSERELARLFNVTRPLVREVLAILEAFGIIEVKDRQGIFIKEKSWNEITLPLSFLTDWPLDILPQVFEARMILEPKAAAIAAKRRTKSDIEKLNEILVEMERFFREDVSERALLGERWNTIFHASVVAATKNDVLCRIHEGIIHLYERNATSFPKENVPMPFEKWPKEIWAEHSSIVNAIVEGDGREAEICAYRHIIATQERIYRFTESLGIDLFGPLMYNNLGETEI
jgi:GntR family transcriptional repressor for pyruvate dehydrogenase complex